MFEEVERKIPSVFHEGIEEEMLHNIMKKLAETTPEEKAVLDKIARILDEHHIRFRMDPRYPRVFTAKFEGKVELGILYSEMVLTFRVTFPSLIQTDSIALTSLGLAEAPESRFVSIKLDADNGEVCASYRYIVESARDLNERSFMRLVNHVVAYALELYPKISQLAVGKVPRPQTRILYEALLKKSLDNLHDLGDEEVQYGTESLKRAIETGDFMRETSAFDEDDEDDEDEWEDFIEGPPIGDIDKPTVPSFIREANSIREAAASIFADIHKTQGDSALRSGMIFEGDESITGEESGGDDNDIS